MASFRLDLDVQRRGRMGQGRPRGSGGKERKEQENSNPSCWRIQPWLVNLPHPSRRVRHYLLVLNLEVAEESRPAIGVDKRIGLFSLLYAFILFQRAILKRMSAQPDVDI